MLYLLSECHLLITALPMVKIRYLRISGLNGCEKDKLSIL